MCCMLPHTCSEHVTSAATQLTYMDVDTRARLLKRVERITRIPLLVLSIVFLVVVALPFLTQLSASAYHLANRIMWLIWGIFVAELLLKIYLAPERPPLYVATIKRCSRSRSR